MNIVGDIDPAAVVCGISLTAVLVLRSKARSRDGRYRYRLPLEYRR